MSNPATGTEDRADHERGEQQYNDAERNEDALKQNANLSRFRSLNFESIHVKFNADGRSGMREEVTAIHIVIQCEVAPSAQYFTN